MSSPVAPAALSIFRPYQKIPTSTNAYNLTSAKLSQTLFRSPKTQWAVLEKVHGSNFSIYTNGTDEVKFAKRTGFLVPGEWFYGYETITEELTTKVKLLFANLKKDYPTLMNVIVYGELFGGFYPSDSTKWKGALSAARINHKQECTLPLAERAIQEGIYYSPKVEFIGFDILVELKDLPGELATMTIDKKTKSASSSSASTAAASSHCEFLAYDRVMSSLKSVDLHHLPPLLIGSFTQVMKFNFIFDSKVSHDILKQPKLPTGTNVAEGVVIKPVTFIDISESDSTSSSSASTSPPTPLRCLVKLKNPAFAEIAAEFELPDTASSSTTLTTYLKRFVTANRFANLLSKMGQLDLTNSAAVEQATQDLMEDVWSDFYAEQMNTTDESPTAPVIKNQQEADTILHQLCLDCIKQYNPKV